MTRRLVVAVLLLLTALGVATAQPLAGTLRDPAHVQIAALIQESIAMEMPPRVEHALIVTLRAAQDAALEGQRSRALTLLRTFAFEVQIGRASCRERV